MKTAFAAALLSLCISAQAFYILIDAGPAAWLEGHKVEQVSVDLFNGDPAIPGELARSRQPFDANLKAVDGQIVAMTEAEISARDAAAQAEAEAQAALYAFPEPDVVVPVLDSEGNATGTARLLVDSDGNIIAVKDTASPQRTVAVQIEEFKAKIGDRESKKAAAKAAKKSGQLQRRIEALESLMGVE